MNKPLRLLRTVPGSWAFRKKDILAGTVVYLTTKSSVGDEISVSTRKDLKQSFSVPSVYLYGD